MPDKHVIIIHGWSDKYENMKEKLDSGLTGSGYSTHYINYKSLEDSATLEDLAEGLFEKLRMTMFKNTPVETILLQESQSPKRTLKFITHSTGALVVRQMIKQYAWYNGGKGIASHIDSIVFLAPANFGSPLAHKAPSLLGRIAKGNRDLEDFGEVGVNILRALELASPKQWELADFDLFGSAPLYGASGIRAFVLTGGSGYDDIIRSFINEDGTDGTIVVSGANLNSRKYVIDFIHGASINDWDKKQPEIPFKIYPKLNHSTILEWDNIKDDVITCLDANKNYEKIGEDFGKTLKEYADEKQYQQFIFRVTDDRERPVTDYLLQFNVWERKRKLAPDSKEIRGQIKMNDEEARLSANLDEMLRENAHPHSVSKEYRRFLVSPDKINKLLDKNYIITMSIFAESGDSKIFYKTKEFENYIIYDPLALVQGQISLFYKNTTTLVEIKIDRYSSLVSRYSPPDYKAI